MTPDRERELETALAALPRLQLASIRPTPLEPLPRLGAELGGPDIFIKRDDLTGLALGGNKTRMLEFSLADALEQGAEAIVTGAAVQSNYCRQMSAACARLGLELHLVLRPVRGIDHEEVQGNHLLMRLLGAHVTVHDESCRRSHGQALADKADQLRASGRKVYEPRTDETVDLDALAYAEAALEVVQQSRQLGIEPRFLYVAAHDTTQAGVVLGLRYLGSGIHVRGFTPIENHPGATRRCAAWPPRGPAASAWRWSSRPATSTTRSPSSARDMESPPRPASRRSAPRPAPRGCCWIRSTRARPCRPCSPTCARAN